MNTQNFIKNSLGALIWLACSGLSASTLDKTPFTSSIRDIPKSVLEQMKKYTWRPNCPLALDQLAYVVLSYWGFDNTPHTGVLIANKKLAPEVVLLFKKLYEERFHIQSISPIEEFEGNDEQSMALNNTSSFNCRPVTGLPGVFSQHSYGVAIDINPLINPYVKGNKVLPPEGIHYTNRHQAAPGKIRKNDFVYQIFSQYGWDWGGNWYDLQDYQHFEKRANGEKRNPYGN